MDPAYPESQPEKEGGLEEGTGIMDLEPADWEMCVWVPDDAKLRSKIISECHETPLMGHFGIKKTADRVS